MKIDNEVVVDAPVGDVWTAINDLERIAPCMPGAQLLSIEGEDFLGQVKVKVGPITAQYKGTATIIESSEEEFRVRIKADGRDTRGAGNATAIITARLTEIAPESTRVAVDTDLTITGKVAQFGRGAMADVSAKLMEVFSDNLEQLLTESTKAGTGDNSPETHGDSDASTVDPAEPEPLDLLAVAGGTFAKVAVPVVVAIALIVVLVVVFVL